MEPLAIAKLMEVTSFRTIRNILLRAATCYLPVCRRMNTFTCAETFRLEECNIPLHMRRSVLADLSSDDDVCTVRRVMEANDILSCRSQP